MRCGKTTVQVWDESKSVWTIQTRRLWRRHCPMPGRSSKEVDSHMIIADTAAFLEVINSAKAVMEKTNPSEEEMSGAAVCRGDRKTGAAAGCDGSAGCGRGSLYAERCDGSPGNSGV